MPADQGKFYGGGGAWYEQPTAEQREAERMAIIEEAHLAGIHGPGRRGCPWCRMGVKVMPERFTVEADRDGGGLELTCPRPECGKSFIGEDLGAASMTLAELYRAAAAHTCTDSASMLPAGVPHNGHYGAPGMPPGAPERARAIAETMPTVGQWPSAGGTEHQCRIEGGRCVVPGHIESRPARAAAFFADGEHAPESPGSDGLGYGRCRGCGETWPCPAVQGK